MSIQKLQLRTQLSILPLFFAGVLLAAAPFSPLLSQQSEDEATDAAEDTAEEAEPFFLTTNVTATLSAVDVFDIPMSVSVIEKLDQKPVNNAADLLLTEPGVDVNGVGANQSRPVIRGQRGLRVLFLEDGLSLNNPRRQADFGEITGLSDLDQMERVEVVRGPSSVLYGSGAIGGVLNMIPARPKAGDGTSFKASAHLRSSSADEQEKVSGALAGNVEKFAYQLQASTREAEDWEAAKGTFGNITLEEEATVFDSGVEDDHLALDLSYQVTDQQVLSLRSTRYSAGEFGFGFVDPALIDPSFDGTQTRIFYPYQDFDRTVLGWSGGGMMGGALNTFDLRLYTQSNERELAFDADINIGPVFPGAPASGLTIDTLNYTDLDTDGLRFSGSRGLGDNSLLTFGVDWVEDTLLNTDTSTTTTTFRFPFPPSLIGVIPGFTCVDFAPPFECSFPDTDDVANTPNSTNEALGLFVQNEFRPSDNFTAIAGVRYQEVDTSADFTPGLDTSGLDFSDDQTVGSLNLLYRLTDSFELVGSYGTAFRAPSIVERLFNGITPEGSGYQILNPGLESETSDYWDVGIKTRKGRGYFDAVFFRNEIDDGIIQNFLSPAEIATLPADLQELIQRNGIRFVVQQRNIDETIVEGFELSGAYRFRNGLSLGGNYTYLDSERRDSLNPPTGDTPSDKLNFYARYQKGRFNVEYRLRYNGEENAVLSEGDPIPPVGDTLPSFTLHGLSAFVELDSSQQVSHQIGLAIQNLTDELYAEFTNISQFRPQPKRNFVLSYRLRFR